jgi:hypothetical protein
MLSQEQEVKDLMTFMAKHLTIRGPLPGEEAEGRGAGGGNGTFANREDFIEISDPNVIRNILMGGGAGGEIHVYQD